LYLQNDPAHENFRKLLETPVQDAEAFIADRCPIPKVIECDQGGSQARFLLAKLNPSATHNSQQYGQSEVIFTDDVSLQVFTDHLARLAVQS
jgi:protein transport protein SEC23